MNLSHISRSMNRKGFTLIELLIVIGILGILAAGLLAAIDPLEQLKRGRDTQRRNIAVELNNALNRYYSVHGSMPWGNGAQAAVALSAATTITNQLTTSGELKSTFTSGAGSVAGDLYIIGAASGGYVYTCFDPESKSISDDPNTIYTSTANPPATGTCGATALCYYCVR